MTQDEIINNINNAAEAFLQNLKTNRALLDEQERELTQQLKALQAHKNQIDRSIKAAEVTLTKAGSEAGSEAEEKDLSDDAAEKEEKAAPAKKAGPSSGLRVAKTGKGPTLRLKDKIIIVMGKDTCRAKDVMQRLESKGWLPNAKAVQNYLSAQLSNNKDVFERVGSGQYRVAKASQPKASQPKASAVDETLDEAGMNPATVEANPW